MRWPFSLALFLLVLCLGISACTASPRATADSFFTEIRAGDLRAASFFCADPENLTMLESTFAEEIEDLTRTYLSRLEFSVGSAQFSSSGASITVEVTLPDIEAITASLSAEYRDMEHPSQLDAAKTEAEFSWQVFEAVSEKLENEGAPTTTALVVVTMTRVNGRWQINNSGGDLIGIILGDVVTVFAE
jgi:hypothetical protein